MSTPPSDLRAAWRRVLRSLFRLAVAALRATIREALAA